MSAGQDYIGHKIGKLKAENKKRGKKRSKKQIIAIALEMARDKGYPVKKKS